MRRLTWGIVLLWIACAGPVFIRPLHVVCDTYRVETYERVECVCMQGNILVEHARWDVDLWYVRYREDRGLIQLYAVEPGLYSIRCYYRPDAVHFYTASTTIIVIEP